ncbi:MAG: Rdx family protein [Candidatus Zixiibacteriota bacterium]|nr:MAG: Rdx family protein [candidate division Zixibacteria bacterium]
MAAAVEKEFGIVANLKEGHGGIFEVALNGRVVFSNLEEGRFPENEEIFRKIREHQGLPEKSTPSAPGREEDPQTQGSEPG